ncbi:MAG: hypothetical protein K2K41_04120, partial [Ruminiclostridium sp.]|nr:hypothetical protein [Ruminiclostridium sp.]
VGENFLKNKGAVKIAPFLLSKNLVLIYGSLKKDVLISHRSQGKLAVIYCSKKNFKIPKMKAPTVCFGR